MKNVALFGFGKLGQHIYNLLPEKDLHCSCVVKKHLPTRDDVSSPHFFQNIHQIDPQHVDICIDVSMAEGIEERIMWAVEHSKPMIIGTTGWHEQRDALLAVAQEKRASIVWGSNFSLGIWLFRKIVREAVRYIKDPLHFDCALFEAHHKLKKDAPSGTLLSIYNDISSLLPTHPECFFSAQESSSSVPKTSIDVATLRVGVVPGTHMVWLDGEEETIQLTHTTRDRKTFARGIITAIQLLEDNPGVWEFDDLLQHALYPNVSNI